MPPYKTILTHVMGCLVCRLVKHFNISEASGVHKITVDYCTASKVQGAPLLGFRSQTAKTSFTQRNRLRLGYCNSSWPSLHPAGAVAPIKLFDGELPVTGGSPNSPPFTSVTRNLGNLPP